MFLDSLIPEEKSLLEKCETVTSESEIPESNAPFFFRSFNAYNAAFELDQRNFTVTYANVMAIIRKQFDKLYESNSPASKFLVELHSESIPSESLQYQLKLDGFQLSYDKNAQKLSITMPTSRIVKEAIDGLKTFEVDHRNSDE